MTDAKGLPLAAELTAGQTHESTRAEPVIARKSNEAARESEPFDVESYRNRNGIERCVGWLKECRRFATRFEKLAVRFLVTVQLAIIRRYLRVGFSNSA